MPSAILFYHLGLIEFARTFTLFLSAKDFVFILHKYNGKTRLMQLLVDFTHLNLHNKELKFSQRGSWCCGRWRRTVIMAKLSTNPGTTNADIKLSPPNE